MVTSSAARAIGRLRGKSLADWKATLDRRAAIAMRTRMLKMRNQRPVASISFDDFPQSAAVTGARILEDRGVHGTFYVCGGLSGREWENGLQFSREDLVRLAARGHEIGCHTFGHRRSTDMTRREIEQEVTRNQAFVKDVLGDYVLTTFAYPYGAIGVAAKRAFQRRFAVCRGIERGVDIGSVDLALVKANLMPSDTDTADWLKPLIEAAVARNGWLNLFTHDVTDHPTPFGCRPAALAAAVDALQTAGIEILPVKNALGRIAFEGT